MDTNITPTSNESEISRSSDGRGRQESRRVVSRGTLSEAEKISTRSVGPEGEIVRSRETVTPTHAAAVEYVQKKRVYYGYQMLWYILGLVEVILSFRFILKLAGANPAAGFSDLVYTLSTPFAAPFAGIFAPAVARGSETTSIVEWSTLVAMAVWGLVAWGIFKILSLSRPISPAEIDRRLVHGM